MNLELTDDEILRLLNDDVWPEDLRYMSRRIVRNAVRCLRCDDIIESAHRHHFAWCAGSHVAVDGGRDYLRRVYTSENDWEEISEHEDLTAEELRTRVDDLLSYCGPVDAAEFKPEAVTEYRLALAGEAERG
jgi:hypothetical protein